MMHAIMRGDAVGALADFFLPKLLKCEDFDRFEEEVLALMRLLTSEAIARCVEAFDAMARKQVPRSWSAHEHTSRTLVTLTGEVSFSRTIFLDEFGRRRAFADELLGIPKRTRLSTGAFLWIVRRATEESYRKTAAAFEERTGCAISHVSVMNCVRAEGAYILSAPPDPGLKTSQETLFVEVDGLWVHLQEHLHRKEALPRFLYEQARKTMSFELKIAAAYAGKRRVGPGRFARDGLVLACSKGDADEFWERAYQLINDTYVVEDLKSVWLGADGAGWCGPERLDESLPEGVDIRCSLDPFHIMQKICRAFPEGSRRDWVVNLAVRRKTGALVRMCKRTAPKADARRRDKIKELGSYIENNAAAVAFPRPSMGTMEGTNAHVGAARLKGQGRSWSREGAEAMCIVRCALATNRPLVAPDKGVFFTQRECDAALQNGVKGARDVPARAGKGYLPPHQARTLSMKTAAGFRANTC